MALAEDISLLQVTAKEPLDELLMQSIREDLYGLDGDINAAGAFDYQFKVNGYLPNLSMPARHLDGAQISKSTTFSACRIMLEQPGDTGTIEVDIRRFTAPNVVITGIEHLFSDTISSIGRVGSSLNTQSIARSTAQIATQSISRWKTQLNITSIVLLGNNEVRYNLSSTPDSDWAIGDSAVFASCTNAANDGTFVIVRVNDHGGSNVVVTNASGVYQGTATGTCDLAAWKFVYTNPVSTEFSAGEIATFASHTSGSNNGAFTIYAINQGGNNIIVKSTSPVAQAGVAGNANANRWIFALSSAAASDYVVGETILGASHSSGGNNGSFRITAVNSGGNNVVAYNANGVAQGGAAGTINTERWTYTFSADPSTSSNVLAGDRMWTDDATSAANRGEFVVKQVNRAAGTNVVVYNAAGVTQGGSGGVMYTHKVKVKFAADQSATITTASRITLTGTTKNSHTIGTIDGHYDVVEVNRGGGANYNAVISKYQAAAIAGACGRVPMESKSLFDTRPSITLTPYNGGWITTSTNAAFNATQKVVPANTIVMMELLSVPTGSPKNLTVQIF